MPDEPPPPQRNSANLPFIVAGILFGALSFLFGGYAAILALPGALPGARRLRAMCVALLVSVPCWLVVGALVGNPVVIVARERVLNQLEAVSGERPTYLYCSGDPLSGRLSFRNLRMTLPEVRGHAQMESFDVQAGFGFFWPREAIEFEGAKADIEVNTDVRGMLGWSKRLGGHVFPPVYGRLNGARVAVIGPQVSAVLSIRVIGFSSEQGILECQASPEFLDVALLGQVHRLGCQGDLYLATRGSETELVSDLQLRDLAGGTAILKGRLGGPAGAPDALKLTIDTVKLGPMWARHRIMDLLEGDARGDITFAADGDDLLLQMGLEYQDLRYYHRSAMRLKDERSFKAESGRVGGQLRLSVGRALTFENVFLIVHRGNLATDPKMKAVGGLGLQVSGTWPDLKGDGAIVVAEGQLNEDIRFTGFGQDISNLAPNLIDLAELLPSLEATFDVEVREIAVNCDPVRGKLKGKLGGTFKHRAGEPTDLQLKGKLELADGKFDFQGASGDITGYIDYQPNVPPVQATIRGELNGKAGDLPLVAEITGRLGAPGLIFKQVKMRPEEFGRAIVEAGEDKLTTQQKKDRGEQLSRLCGAEALFRRNPFAVLPQGKVFFEFRTGD
ncbi:MAG: hypothetical protein IT462_07415 [Planctomycetes bacterium]|nr:hypothetical protein [Planctomycetota bacterium]